MVPSTECDARQVYNFEGDYLKPDLFDRVSRRYGEVKPLSINGIVSGKTRIELYDAAFAVHGWARIWGWSPPSTVIASTRVHFINIDGIVFYTDSLEEKAALAGLTIGVLLSRYKSFWRNNGGPGGTAASPLGAEVTAGRVVLRGVGAVMAAAAMRLFMPVIPSLVRI